MTITIAITFAMMTIAIAITFMLFTATITVSSTSIIHRCFLMIIILSSHQHSQSSRVVLFGSNQGRGHQTQHLLFLSFLRGFLRFRRFQRPERVLRFDQVLNERSRRAQDVEEVARLATGADAVVVVAARGLVEVGDRHELGEEEDVVELLAGELLDAVGGRRLVLVHDVDVAEQVRAHVVAHLQLAHAAEVRHAHPDLLVEAVEVLHEPLFVVVDDLAVRVGRDELGVGVAHGQHHGRRDGRHDVDLAALVLVAAGALAHVELADFDLVCPAAVLGEDDVRALDGLAGGNDELALDWLLLFVEGNDGAAVLGRNETSDTDTAAEVLLNTTVDILGVILKGAVSSSSGSTTTTELLLLIIIIVTSCTTATTKITSTTTAASSKISTNTSSTSKITCAASASISTTASAAAMRL